MSQPFEHVVIIGCGLLGASLGLALRRHGLARQVTGVGRPGSASTRIALERGAVDRVTSVLAGAVGGSAVGDRGVPADLVVVCTPVRQFPETFRSLAPALAPGAIVTDVGSTKAQVMAWAAEMLPAGAHFVGSHPMAGSEKSGPEHARADLYERAVCLLCPVKGIVDPPAERVAALWRALGMRVTICEPEQHDQWVALVSHLPHAVAHTLFKVAARDPAALEAAAGGLVDTTRIASGDPAMWTDIFLTNRAAVVERIDAYIAALQQVRATIAGGNEQTLRRELLDVKQARDTFLSRRRAAQGE